MGGFGIDWYINVKIYSMGANFVLNSWMKFNSPEAESSYMAMGKTSVKFSYGNYLFHVIFHMQTKVIVIPPNSNMFPDWRRTCHVPLVKTQ